MVTLALGVGWVAPAASAEPVNPLTASVDNPEAVAVSFGYLSVNPTYGTWSSDLAWGMTSCTGQVQSCWFGHPQPWAAYMNPAAPIAPGASRTVTITYDVAPDSPCGSGRAIAFVC